MCDVTDRLEKQDWPMSLKINTECCTAVKDLMPFRK
jgi:hypothetical protein